MNQDLIKNNYLVLRNFIPADTAKVLADDFTNLEKEVEFSDDEGWCGNAVSWNNTPVQLALLCDVCSRVSEICGESLLPTYVFGRIYKKDSVLVKHSDRAACEVSLTLHLYGDKEWDFCVGTPYYENHCVTLYPGDAMLYLGCVAEHWRDQPYSGEKYIQYFLHYVRAFGYCQGAYFDNGEKEYKKLDRLALSNILKKEYYELR